MSPNPERKMPAMTPGKHPFALPTQALADAVAAEWASAKKFSPTAMPLTALAYTAIDQVNPHRDAIVDVMLAYVDTDTLCYRASGSDILLKQQKEEWDPVLNWAAKKFGAIWQTTTGINPLSQSDALHAALRDYLQKLDDMHLSGCCMLASLCSSLVLALALSEKYLNAEKAFRLSRLEEDFQAEQWGREEETHRRAMLLKAEIAVAARFLQLLDSK